MTDNDKSVTALEEFGIGVRTAVMGVLNVTPDSFYDGGRFRDAGAAVERAAQMAAEGADIIDVGGESTRPGADPVPADEEASRVVPVIERLVQRLDVPVSIDTCKASVAERALDAGARMLNDVGGLRLDPEMARVAAQHDAAVVIMHMKGTPRDMQLNPTYEDVIGEITEFLRRSIGLAVEAGVREERIIVDPGIGFGKRPEHNIEILARLGEFRSLGRPIMVGTSRKSFIGGILGVPAEERLMGTMATVALAIREGASVVRVHDVKEAVQVARVADAVCAAMPAREQT